MGKQLHDPPASGTGIDDATNKEDVNKKALEVCRPLLRETAGRVAHIFTEFELQSQGTFG